MLSFIMYFPIISAIIGAPIPFPSLLDVKPEQIAIFNFMSLLVTILGSIVGIGFYLERRQNLKIDILRQDIKDLRAEMKEMETRLCNTVSSRNVIVEKTIEQKVNSAKDLVDAKFRHMEQIARGMQKTIDFIQQFQFGSGAKSIPPYISGMEESQEHRDQPSEGMYKSPDSTKREDQKFKYDLKEKFQERKDREKASKKRWDDATEEEDGDGDG